MSGLPTLLAVTTDALCRAPGFLERCAAVGSPGAEVALVVRAPESSTAEQAVAVERTMATVVPLGALVLVHARPDLARAVGADGVQLRRPDLPPAEARRVLGAGWIGVSVHDREAAEAAIAEGADYLVAGNVFETSTHPDRPARGLAWLRDLCALERPVFAIGGITAERVAAVRAAGATGVAAITAVWQAADPAAAVRSILSAWSAST